MIKLANYNFLLLLPQVKKENRIPLSILARSLSFSNLKVLIIETDIRVPKVEDYMNVKGKKRK